MAASEKMLVCGKLYRRYKKIYKSDPGGACRSVKKATRRGCKWSKKAHVTLSCKRKY